MTKVVINTCFGGFRLSEKAALRLAEKKNIRPVFEQWNNRAYRWFLWDQPFGEPVEISDDMFERADLEGISSLDRSDPDLVAVVEELADEAGEAPISQLKVVEVPDDVHWHISEYDGVECVAEDHRIWQ